MSKGIVLLVLAQWAILLAIALRAMIDGYWSMEEARRSEPDPEKPVAALNQHGGYWACYPITAWIGYIIEKYAAQWSATTVVVTLCVWLIFSVFILAPHYVKLSNNLSEAFARKGLVSIPGTIFYPGLGFIGTMVTLYYFFTPNVNPTEAARVAAALAFCAGVAILMPEWVTHKKFRPFAVLLMLFICMALAVATYARFRFF